MDDDDLSALIRQHATRHRADPLLKSGILAEIAVQTAAGEASEVRAQDKNKSRERTRWPWWSLSGSGFAAGALASLTAMVLVSHLAPDSSADQSIEATVVDSHIRALMAQHLTDVTSTDQHTVKPWFQGKLNYSPPVRDFVSQGFPLVGGRLDYLDGRPVAALVYRHGQHMINVFVWPGSPRPVAPQSHEGFHVQEWTADGMQFWAVSDVNAADLQGLQRLWLTP